MTAPTGRRATLPTGGGLWIKARLFPNSKAINPLRCHGMFPDVGGKSIVVLLHRNRPPGAMRSRPRRLPPPATNVCTSTHPLDTRTSRDFLPVVRQGKARLAGLPPSISSSRSQRRFCCTPDPRCCHPRSPRLPITRSTARSRSRSTRRASTDGARGTVRARLLSSDQHALDAAAIGLRDVIRHPLVAQDVPCKLDDDVVGLRTGIVGEAGQPLQARRA